MREADWSLGIDVGSVTLKLALLDSKNTLIYSSYDKHYGHPQATLLSSLETLQSERPDVTLNAIAVTGSARELISQMLDIPPSNEIVAHSVATSLCCPGVRTIIEIGGQDSKFVELGPLTPAGEATILSQRMNDICAAGTGAFIEQQALRLGVEIEDFGATALRSSSPAMIAGRCSVFSKTDIIHLTQEGRPIEDIAAGICAAVVRNYIAQFSKGRKFTLPIAFQGGLAANSGVVAAFRTSLGIDDSELLVPEHYGVMGALGSALLARKMNPLVTCSLRALIALAGRSANIAKAACPSPQSLSKLSGHTLRFNSFKESTERPSSIFLGIDAGSTSTCVAALANDGSLLAENYTLNQGSLVNSVDKALADIHTSLKEQSITANIAAVAATGSGRQLISGYVGADLIRDEISAQAKAAVTMLPDVDTVIEIGGQDSKYIQIANGRIVDFEMNRICAAGTGSFLQEQALRLGEEMHTLSSLALASETPANLGNRCTVFMESDLINFQQLGVPKADLAAGLSYSLAQNYLEKVVAGKHIGQRILMLGGCAYNNSVVAAFQELLGKEVLVPEENGVSAAIGAALIAKEQFENQQIKESEFVGFDAPERTYKLSSFQCSDCSNSCRVSQVTTGGGTFCYSSACGKHETKRQKKLLPNPFREREKLLMSFLRTPNGKQKPRIAIPRAQLFYEFFPLWCVFLQELGFEVVVSDRTNKEITCKGLEKTCIDNCFASKLVYGHVQDLLDKGIRKIFFPSIVEFERKVTDLERNYSCPHVQAMPSLIRTAFGAIKVIAPTFVRDRSDRDWQKELARVGVDLGFNRKTVQQALEEATEAQASFVVNCEALGQKYLAEASDDQRICVILGKVYNVCDPALNLNIAKKFLDTDVLPIPYDCLPLSDQELPINYMDMVWSSGQDLIRAAKIVAEDPRLHPVMVTNFGCGPDSFATKYLQEIFKEKSFLILEVDEHSSAIGTLTRIEAFLSNIKEEAPRSFGKISEGFQPFIPSGRLRKLDRLLYIPIGFDSYLPIAAAFESIGIRTKLLPVHDERTKKLGRAYSSGTECLPYIMHVGDAIRMTEDPEFDPETSALYLPASDLGCRVSLFTTSIGLVLRDLGYPDVPIIAPRVSMDKDEALNFFGMKFARNLVQGMLAVELLGRLLPQKRAYETVTGSADQLYQDGIKRICSSISDGSFWSTLTQVLSSFDQLELDLSSHRPIIGLVGDDYTRGNAFANNNIVRNIEDMGGEVWTVPIWSSYLEFQMSMKPQKMWRRGRYLEFLTDTVKATLGKIDIKQIERQFAERLQCYPDPSFSEMMEFGTQYVDERNEPLTIMALSHINHLLSSGVDGLVNLVGFQCMIHSIVLANMKPVCARYGNIPVLSLFFDFQENIHQKNRLEAFMYQVSQFRDNKNNLEPGSSCRRLEHLSSIGA